VVTGQFNKKKKDQKRENLSPMPLITFTFLEIHHSCDEEKGIFY